MRGRRDSIPFRQVPETVSGNPVARILAALRDPAYRGSYALVASNVGTNVIGAAYWAVAARLYGAAALGRATALISALMLVATLSQLNLSATLMRFLPQMGAMSAGRMIKFSYLTTSLTALAGSVIFVAVMPRLSSEWHFLGGSAFLAVLFAVSVVVWEIFTLQDSALVGLQRPGAVPIENVVYSLAKLTLLVAALRLIGSTDILVSWMIPLVLLIPVINWLIFRCLKDRPPQDMVPGMRLRHLARFASVDYLGVICGQITANVLPLLVISVLGPSAEGSFYIASLITSGVASLGISFSTGLLVEAAAAPERLPELTRGGLKRCVMVMGPATIVLVFGARIILKVYGGSYIAHTLVLFQLLGLTLLPFCISTIAFSLDRIAGKPIRATLSALVNAVLTLGGSWFLFRRFGLNGVGVAVLGADTAIAIVRLPTVLAVVLRRPGEVAQPTSAAQQAAAPGSDAPARQEDGPPHRRDYAGRHRTTGPGAADPRTPGRPDPPSRRDPRTAVRRAPRTELGLSQAQLVAADPRTAARADPRIPSRADPRTPGRADPRVPSRPDPRAVDRPDPRTVGRPDPRTAGRPDPRTAGRPDPRTAGRPDPRTAGRPDPPTAGRPDPRTAGRPDPRTAGRPDPRTAGRPDPRTADTKPYRSR
jgi:O-antigen/teichoic acid export membrane protein